MGVTCVGWHGRSPAMLNKVWNKKDRALIAFGDEKPATRSYKNRTKFGVHP